MHETEAAKERVSSFLEKLQKRIRHDVSNELRENPPGFEIRVDNLSALSFHLSSIRHFKKLKNNSLKDTSFKR